MLPLNPHFSLDNHLSLHIFLWRVHGNPTPAFKEINIKCLMAIGLLSHSNQFHHISALVVRDLVTAWTFLLVCTWKPGAREWISLGTDLNSTETMKTKQLYTADEIISKHPDNSRWLSMFTVTMCFTAIGIVLYSVFADLAVEGRTWQLICWRIPIYDNCMKHR